MKRLALILAALTLLSSCSQETLIPDVPAVSASVTEEVTTAEETLPAPEVTEELTEEMTEELTEEVTSPPETEAIPETEPEDIELLSPGQLLEFVEGRAATYYSFRKSTLTTLAVNVLGSETYSETDSELTVKGSEAVFKRGGKEGFENLYLVGGELYTENALGKCRIGGYNRETFLGLVNDMPISVSFTGGVMERDGEDYLLKFTSLGEGGKALLREMLGLPEEYAVSFGETRLEMRVDKMANMLECAISIKLSVSAGGAVVMTVSIGTETKMSDIGKAIPLSLPAAEDYVFFTSDSEIDQYSAIIKEITLFTASYSKFEYSVRDDMVINDLPLSSTTVYAYNSKIGASIDKAFDLGDGTGRHTTLTHFNRRRGFSQIDGGSIFVDTTINANNLGFTLYYPFTTSYFGFDHCIGMNAEKSGEPMKVFDLDSSAVKNIADNLLLRVGVLSSSAELSGVEAYTYFKLSADGKIEAIGYSFKAVADVSGVKYTLAREVELDITSRDSANIKVIYIDVEDDE